MNRSQPSRFKTLTALIAGLVLLSGVAIDACDIPVFRYGLERWPTEPHLLTLSSNAPVDISSINRSHANIAVQRTAAPQNQEVLVTYVDSQTAWYEGPWEPNLISRLSDSPMRRRVAHDLLTGTSAVWILLESDNPATNAAISALVKERIGKFSRETVLTKENPAAHEEQTEENKLYTTIPLKVSFTLHSLSRNDPDETFFVRQILGAYPDPIPPQSPVLVAIFGQGRMIPVPVDMITPVFVGDLCAFLCGDCSCQIKSMNPGMDLAMAVNWDEAARNYPASSPTLLPDGKTFVIGGTGTLDKAVFASPRPVVAATPSTPAKEATPPSCKSGNSKVIVYSAIALLGAVVIGLLLKSKKN
jgi:hypothetical protein